MTILLVSMDVTSNIVSSSLLIGLTLLQNSTRLSTMVITVKFWNYFSEVPLQIYLARDFLEKMEHLHFKSPAKKIIPSQPNTSSSGEQMSPSGTWDTQHYILQLAVATWTV